MLHFPYSIVKVYHDFNSKTIMSFFPQVILWGRTEKCLKETCDEISMTGTECYYFVCDVGNREEVYQQAKVLREKVHSHTRHLSLSLCHSLKLKYLKVI